MRPEEGGSRAAELVVAGLEVLLRVQRPVFAGGEIPQQAEHGLHGQFERSPGVHDSRRVGLQIAANMAFEFGEELFGLLRTHLADLTFRGHGLPVGKMRLILLVPGDLPRGEDQAGKDITTLADGGEIPPGVGRVAGVNADGVAVDAASRLAGKLPFGRAAVVAEHKLIRTENYNGQLTGQDGIHGFSESRLPELFAKNYDFFTGKAEYIKIPQLAAWKAIDGSNIHLDSVLLLEKRLSEKFGEKKFSFETKGKQTIKVYSVEFSTAYHNALSGTVEQRMRDAIK